MFQSFIIRSKNLSANNAIRNSKKVLSARSHTKRSWENQTISMWFVLFWNRSKMQLKKPHPSSSWQNQAISMSNVLLWGNPEKTIITTYSSRSRRSVATVTTCLWLKQNYFHGKGSKYENILDTQSWYLLALYGFPHFLRSVYIKL